MSTNSASAKQTSPEAQQAQAQAGIAGLVLLVTAKYLPIILVGALIGMVVQRGARGTAGWKRAESFFWGLSFFILLWFGLFGPPFQKVRDPLLGLIYLSESFKDGVVQVSVAWNRYFNLPIIKVLQFDLRHSTFYDVTNYFWIAILTSAIIIALHEGWSLFQSKDRTQRQELGLGTKVCSLPQKASFSLFHLVLFRWIVRGQATAALSRRDGLRAFLRGSMTVVLLSLVAALSVAYVLPRMMPLSLIHWVGYFMFAPAIGVAIGLIMGVVYTLTGGQSLPSTFSRKRREEFHLGKDFQGRAYELSDKNLSYHIEVIAPTGSGKTNLLKNLIQDRIQRGHGLIFLDLKAEFQVVSWMTRAARAAGRQAQMRLVSLANRELSVPYNPIKQGLAPEIHSQIMNSMSWSEDYYRKVSSMALMTLLRGLCEYRDRTGEHFHLGHLYELLNEPGRLRAFAEELALVPSPVAHELELLAEKLDRPSERDKLTGLVANLGLLIHSAAGPLISQDVTSGSFDFREAVDEGRITYVLMNSMKLRETASVFGKMILQDLMRLAGDRYSELSETKHHRPVTLIIDEFAAFAIPEFIEFMDRARGAGIGIVFAHQSRADLRAVTPEFQDRVEANSNTVIVSGVKSSEDAEYFAGQLGTRSVEKQTVQVEDGFLGQKRTGMKSVRQTEEYVVHPNRLKDLQQGEIFTVSRTVDPRWGILKVPQAKEFPELSVTSEELQTTLSAIRTQYMTNSKERYLDLAALSSRVHGLSRRAVSQPAGHKSDVRDEKQLEPHLWS